MKMRNVFVLLVCFLFIMAGVLKGCGGGSGDNPASLKALCAVIPDDEGEPESDDCSGGGITGQTLNLATQRSTDPYIFITVENTLTDEVRPDDLNDFMVNSVHASYPNSANIDLGEGTSFLSANIDAGGGTALFGSYMMAISNAEATFFDQYDPFVINLTITYSGVTAGGAKLDVVPFVFPIVIINREPSSANSYVSASASAVEESSTITVTVKVLDSNNSEVQGADVQLVQSGAGVVSVTPAKASTNEDGEAEFTVGGSTAGIVTLTAYWGSLLTDLQSTGTEIGTITLTVSAASS